MTTTGPFLPLLQKKHKVGPADSDVSLTVLVLYRTVPPFNEVLIAILSLILCSSALLFFLNYSWLNCSSSRTWKKHAACRLTQSFSPLSCVGHASSPSLRADSFIGLFREQLTGAVRVCLLPIAQIQTPRPPNGCTCCIKIRLFCENLSYERLISLSTIHNHITSAGGTGPWPVAHDVPSSAAQPTFHIPHPRNHHWHLKDVKIL